MSNACDAQRQRLVSFDIIIYIQVHFKCDMVYQRESDCVHFSLLRTRYIRDEVYINRDTNFIYIYSSIRVWWSLEGGMRGARYFTTTDLVPRVHAEAINGKGTRPADRLKASERRDLVSGVCQRRFICGHHHELHVAKVCVVRCVYKYIVETRQ